MKKGILMGRAHGLFLWLNLGSVGMEPDPPGDRDRSVPAWRDGFHAVREPGKGQRKRPWGRAYRSLPALALLLAWGQLSNAGSAVAFDLRSVHQWGCELVNGPMEVKCLYYGFSISAPAGKLSMAFRDTGRLDEIKVEKDTENVKRVTLLSEPLSWVQDSDPAHPVRRYTITFEARREFSSILVEMGLENLGDKAIPGYFFLRLGPMFSEYYITEHGQDKVDAVLHTGEWVYLPAENRTDGLGIVFDPKRKGLRFGTNYPNKGWKSAGYYFMRNMQIGKGGANRISFAVFPASDEGEAETSYRLLRERNIFPELWE